MLEQTYAVMAEIPGDDHPAEFSLSHNINVAGEIKLIKTLRFLSFVGQTDVDEQVDAFGDYMARPRKDGEITVEILYDGVFHAEDERSDKGDKVRIPPEIADILIERGHARKA